MRPWWLAVVFVWSGFSARTEAQPIVRVRAETRLEVALASDGGTPRIVGTLRDDAGSHIAGRPIAATLRGQAVVREEVSTENDGTFEIAIPSGMDTAELRFEGEPFLLASSARLQLSDARAHVTLQVETPGGGEFSLDLPEHVLAVQAESPSGGAGLPITLSNELGQLLAAGTTDPESRWVATLPSSELGAMGAGRLVVRSAADDQRAAAQTELPIVRSRATHLSLRTAVWDDAGLHVEGSLETQERPLERRAVSVLVDGELAGTALTQPDGSLQLRVPKEGLPSQDFAVQLRFDSDAPWLASSTSEAFTVSPPTRQWLLPALALLSVVLALGLARRPSMRVSDADIELPKIDAGVTLQKPSKRAESQVDGLVVRAGMATPIASAQVSTDRDVLCSTDALGTFAFALSPGTHALRFEAPGYETLTLRVPIPHRGEWLGVVVRLRSRRDLANDMMLNAFAPRIPREDWGAATNRELFAKARERGTGSPELLALVDAVEALVYAPRAPESEDLAQIEALARATQNRTR